MKFELFMEISRVEVNVDHGNMEIHGWGDLQRETCARSDIVTLWFDCAVAWKRWIIMVGVCERSFRGIFTRRSNTEVTPPPERLLAIQFMNKWETKSRRNSNPSTSLRALICNSWIFCAAQCRALCLTHLCLIAQSRLRLRGNLFPMPEAPLYRFERSEMILKPFGSQRPRCTITVFSEVLCNQEPRSGITAIG